MSRVRNRAGADYLEGGARRDHRVSPRLVAAAVLGGLLILFAALNSQSVRIHWLFTTTQVPLILVIVACGLIGAAIASLFAWRRRGRR